MKKLTLAVLLWFCIFNICNAQIKYPGLHRSAYQDAIDLAENSKQSDILKKYFSRNTEIDSFNIKYGLHLPLAISDNKGITVNDIQAGSDVALLSNPVLAVDALGTFIANRFKKEINISFLNKLKEDFNNPRDTTLKYLHLLFPKSSEVLQNSDPYNYPVFMETLKQGFEEDLSILPNNLIKVVPAISNKPEYLLIAKMLDPNFRVNYFISINDFSNELQEDTTNNKFRKVVYSASIISNMVYKGGTKDGSVTVITKIELNKLKSDSSLLSRYIALLIKQNEKTLGAVVPQKDSIIKLLAKLIPVYNSLSDQANILRSAAAEKKLSRDTLQTSFAILITSIQTGVSEYKKLINPTLNTDALDKILSTAESANNISRYIIERKYGLALINTIEFVNSSLNKNIRPETKQKVGRYCGFITNVLSATTKDDMVQALETAANPVGSYRIKRNSTFNISLNAFAGGFYGYSFLKDTSLFGFTAPVGLYFGFGNIGKKNNKAISNYGGKSLGLFFPLVDVGAVTAFRLKDGNTQLADISWTNVFSPGAYISYGFGKCPISLNLGGQLGPELNGIDKDGKPAFYKKEWFWRASVVIDIPFFDFLIK